MNGPMFTPSALKVPCLIIGLCLGLTTTLVSQPTRASAGNPEQANDVYLYGEAADADQIGKGYAVFSQKNGRVVGAFYHPASEFTCFTGTVQDSNLQVIALGYGAEDNTHVQMQLSKMHQIHALTEMSKRTLAMCEQEIAQRPGVQLRAKNR